MILRVEQFLDPALHQERQHSSHKHSQAACYISLPFHGRWWGVGVEGEEREGNSCGEGLKSERLACYYS